MSYLPKGTRRYAVVEAYTTAQFRGANDAVWPFAWNPTTQGPVTSYLTGVTGTFAATTAVITCALGSTGLAAGTAVYYTGGTANPTSFNPNTVYYVSATGLSAGTSFEVAATIGGTPISNGAGGSAGTGTFTFYVLPPLANVAQVGDLLVDTVNAIMYQNTGTSAHPIWTSFGAASGSGAWTGTFNGTLGATTPAAINATTIGAVTPGSGVFTTLGTTGLRTTSLGVGLTAAGSNAATSLALTKEYNQVTVAATTAVGVTLPAATAGLHAQVTYISGTAASIKLWPASTDQIDAGGAGTNQVITKGKIVDLYCFTAGYWVSDAHVLTATT